MLHVLACVLFAAVLETRRGLVTCSRTCRPEMYEWMLCRLAEKCCSGLGRCHTQKNTYTEAQTRSTQEDEAKV